MLSCDSRCVDSPVFFFSLWFVVFSEVTAPSFIAVNLSNDGYFLPPHAIETERHLLDFLNGVLDGSIQVSPTSCFTRRTTMEVQQHGLILLNVSV